jgi:hypothetical protein
MIREERALNDIISLVLNTVLSLWVKLRDGEA